MTAVLSLALPVQLASPVAPALAGSAMSVIRLFFGLGMLTAVLMMFKPHRSQEEHAPRRSSEDDVLMLDQMARELDATQPDLALELRLLAAHH